MSWRRGRTAVAWAVGVLLIGGAVYALWLDPALWTWIGDRRLRGGELVPAERAFQRALAIDISHGPALCGLGWSYLRAGLVEPARERFQQAVDRAPAYYGGHRGLAMVHAARGELRAAEDRLRAAHQLAPGEPGVLADLGGLYLDAGHPDEALELFQRAIERAPGRAEFRLSMAEALLTLERVDEARARVEEARTLRVRDARFAGAADQLLLRAALVDVEMGLRDEPDAASACAGWRSLLDGAQAHLDGMVAAGTERAIVGASRRELEGVRARVAALCAEG